MSTSPLPKVAPRPDSAPTAPGRETDQGKFWELGARLANSYSDALTVINGHASLLLSRPDLDPATSQHASAIFRAGEQAARLTRRLMIVGGRHPIRPESVDLGGLVADTLPSIQILLGADRTVETKTCNDNTVSADPEMLEQVLLILAANAAEALPPDGKLTITTEARTFPDATDSTGTEDRTGKFVCLTFQDTGCGMTPDTLARAFEPFFTTKKTGQATSGLGLAVAQSIVQSSQGWLTAESRPQVGTTVKIFLPCVSAHGRPAAASGVPPSARTGKPTILLVDDELALRELTAMVLQNQGFRVLQAGDGAEALEVWKWHAPRVDLLFTDLVMPGNFTGLDLAAKFQMAKPTLKIICMTGNLDHLPHDGTAKLANIRYLQKPCSPKDVERAVQALLAPVAPSLSALDPPPN